MSNYTLRIWTNGEGAFGDQDFDWHILIHDLESFVQHFKIPINKALCIWHSCFDSRTLFCYTYNYIYVLDIFEKNLFVDAISNMIELT